VFDDDPIIILRRRFSLSCLCSADENKKNEETKQVKKVKKEKKRVWERNFSFKSEKKEELKNTREIIDTFYYSHLHFKKNDYCY